MTTWSLKKSEKKPLNIYFNNKLIIIHNTNLFVTKAFTAAEPTTIN
jgi:hypothetical protein